MPKWREFRAGMQFVQVEVKKQLLTRKHLRNMTTFQNQRTGQRRTHSGAGPFSRLIDEILSTNLGDVIDSAFVATKPFVNMLETGSAFELHVAAPGLSKGDFKLEVREGLLHVSVDTEAQSPVAGTEFRSKEFDYHHFNRTFRLNDLVDTEAISARYDNGILVVSLPKKAKETWKKEIRVD